MFDFLVSLPSTPVTSVGLLGGGALMYAVLYRGARLPRTPWYAEELVLSSALCPFLVTALVFGAAFLGRQLIAMASGELPSSAEAATALAVGAVFAAVTALVARTVPRSRPESVVVTLGSQTRPAPSPESDVTLPRAA